METIWITMFGKTFVFCIALVNDTPVATSPCTFFVASA